MNTTSIKSSQELLDIAWMVFLSFAVVIAYSMIPVDVLAQTIPTATTTGANPIERTMCKVVGFMTGTTGKAIATIAIIIVGLGALMGKISWGMALIVALGVAIIFGASQIVDVISPDTAQKAC